MRQLPRSITRARARWISCCCSHGYVEQGGSSCSGVSWFWLWGLCWSPTLPPCCIRVCIRECALHPRVFLDVCLNVSSYIPILHLVTLGRWCMYGEVICKVNHSTQHARRLRGTPRSVPLLRFFGFIRGGAFLGGVVESIGLVQNEI